MWNLNLNFPCRTYRAFFSNLTVVGVRAIVAPVWVLTVVILLLRLLYFFLLDAILTNHLLALKFFFLDGNSTIFDSFDILVELGSVFGGLASLDANIIFVKGQDCLLVELIIKIHCLQAWRGTATTLWRAPELDILLLA